MNGNYVKGKDANGKDVFKKLGDDSIIIENTQCGWNILKLEPSQHDPLRMEQYRLARTYTGQCAECVGTCLTEDALDTSTTYDGWGKLQAGISIKRHVCGPAPEPPSCGYVEVSCEEGQCCLLYTSPSPRDS